MEDLFQRIHTAITLNEIEQKCAAAKEVFANFEQSKLQHDGPVNTIPTPGLPENLEMVAPKMLKRRSVNSQAGRNTLMHAIAHIEFNAINLALDAAYRFRYQPSAYYQDWLAVAADEARHFLMIQDYLATHDCRYGDYPVHNGLWEMAVKTDHDVLTRMALVPRVLEARGLDVTPGMINKLQAAGDVAAADVLQTIYQDEIGHVEVGSRWFHYHCQQQGVEPLATFRQLVDKHLHGGLQGPFNNEARLQAGFTAEELEGLL